MSSRMGCRFIDSRIFLTSRLHQNSFPIDHAPGPCAESDTQGSLTLQASASTFLLTGQGCCTCLSADPEDRWTPCVGGRRGLSLIDAIARYASGRRSEVIERMTLNFTAIDVETANYRRASICSVGLCKVRDGQILLSTSWLVDPPGGRTFERMNVRQHGITAADLNAARSWGDSLGAILDFGGGDVFAHHGMFDRQAMVQACQLSGLEFPPLTSIDTLAVAKTFMSLESFRLEDVARSLALPPFQHHNAEEDAVTCARIIIALERSHGGLAELFSSSPTVKGGASSSVRSLASTSPGLHPWVRQKIDDNPYSEDNHNSWLDFVLAHPDGRATEGTPCIECGSPIDQRTNYKFKDRHCCVKCADKLKKRAKRYAESLAQNQIMPGMK